MKHKSQLTGGRGISWIWKHGAELIYLDDEGIVLKLWLCRVCHSQKLRNDAKKCNSYHHIADHLSGVHRISKEGFMPDLPKLPSSPFEVAANVAGAERAFSHKPYAEDKLQSAWVDWVISKDVSFATATSAATRALLTWNRSELLAAFPSSSSTLSGYLQTTLEMRKVEVEALVAGARSNITVSVDIWSSGNRMSFMAVVSHFAGKSTSLSCAK